MKLSRLKQAKDEAEREVANYRSHMEAEYQKSISEVVLAFPEAFYMRILCFFFRVFFFNMNDEVYVWYYCCFDLCSLLGAPIQQ